MQNKLLLSATLFISFVYGVGVGHCNTESSSLQKTNNTSTSQTSTPRPPFATSQRYLSHQKLFSGLTGEFDIVFLGDSITNAGRWSEAFPSLRVANRGISGDTSKGILNRVNQIVTLKPKTVYLMFGINDIKRGGNAVDIFARYQKIINILVNKNIEVVLQSTLLSSREHWNIEVTKLNQFLVTLAKERQYTYIDLNKVFAPSGLLTKQASSDGVHLKAEMYLNWFELIKDSRQ